MPPRPALTARRVGELRTGCWADPAAPGAGCRSAGRSGAGPSMTSALSGRSSASRLFWCCRPPPSAAWRRPAALCAAPSMPRQASDTRRGRALGQGGRGSGTCSWAGDFGGCRVAGVPWAGLKTLRAGSGRFFCAWEGALGAARRPGSPGSSSRLRPGSSKAQQFSQSRTAPSKSLRW